MHRRNSACRSERRQGRPFSTCPWYNFLRTPFVSQLVYLPEASDFIAPTPQVLSLSSRLTESTFVQAIRDEAQTSGVWVGVGIHQVVSIQSVLF